MIDSVHALLAIAAMGAVTFVLRALPFLAARWLARHPVVQRLGDFLPLAIMALLLVHSVAGAAREDPAGPWPEGIAVALAAVLQWWGRHALLSILVGTAAYVLMRNFGGL